MVQRRDIFVLKTGSPLTKSMITGLLLCVAYYVFACWISYEQLSHSFALWLIILFGSGMAGLEVSIWLLMPFSKEVKRALGFLLGVNGAISAIGWMFISQHVVNQWLSMFGLAQFFYFSFSSFQDEKEVDDNSHGS